MLRAASAILTPSLDSARASEADRPAPAPTISAVLNLTSVMANSGSTPLTCEVINLAQPLVRQRWHAF